VGKKGYKRKILSLQRQIQIHEEKLSIEEEKAIPDEGLINHWKREIRGFYVGISKTKKRLGERDENT
jgi:hypothetical protein